MLRVALVSALFCGLLTAAGLQRRADQEAGLDLRATPPAGPAVGPLGVTVELQGVASPERRQTLTRLRAAGFSWVRQPVDWGELEPAPGRFRWQLSDPLLADLGESDMAPVIVLMGSPAWARAEVDLPPHDNPTAPPQDPADLARFAAAFAARYGQQVRYYQIWDEPNIAPHWGNRLIDPVAYAQLLQAASSAIRGVDPDALILLAALAPTSDRGHSAIDEIYFLQRLYAAGAADQFDIVAIQPFGFGRSPTDPRQSLRVLNFARAALLRRALIHAGHGDMPIWAVRYGWNNRTQNVWGTVSMEHQSQYAAAALEHAASRWPWLTTLGWAIDQPLAPPEDPEWGFALIDVDGRPTPVWESLRRWAAQAETRQQAVPTAATAGLISGLRWLALGTAGALLLWRGWWAARLLPWQGWLRRYRRLPWPLRGFGWVALLILYYLAVWPPLIGLCWAVAAFWIAAYPRTGLWLAAALLPFHFYHKEIGLVDGVWTVAPAYAALICLLPSMALALRPPWARWLQLCPAPYSWIGGAWLLIQLASAGSVNHWPAYWRGLTETAVAPLLLFLAVRLFVRNRRQLQQTTAALAGGAVLAAAAGLWGWSRGDGIWVDGVLRLVGPTFSPNHLALYLERGLFLTAALWAGELSWRRWGWGTASGLLLAALALTASRGAWLLGIPAGALALGWLAHPRAADRPRRRLPLGPLLWFAAGLGLGLLLLFGFSSRLTNSESVLNRLIVWQGSWHLWLDHLWLGVGSGHFFWSYPAYLLPQASEPDLLHPHNVWLEFATHWGLVGLTWLLVTVVVLWRQASRHLQPGGQSWIGAALMAAFAAALAHGQVDAFMVLADLAGWNWLALGLWSIITAGPLAHTPPAPEPGALPARPHKSHPAHRGGFCNCVA